MANLARPASDYSPCNTLARPPPNRNHSTRHQLARKGNAKEYAFNSSVTRFRTQPVVESAATQRYSLI